uniref:Uncharacterized protein n=1 Tax=Romanomermis culicivorax TaxID=13658 RepID=A0A915HLL1_ROMCU
MLNLETDKQTACIWEGLREHRDNRSGLSSNWSMYEVENFGWGGIQQTLHPMQDAIFSLF